MADHSRIMQQEKPLCVYYYLKIKYKQQKSNKTGENAEILRIFQREGRARGPRWTVPGVTSTHSLRCRGAGCSSPPRACRPCSRQSGTGAPCPPR